MKSLKDILYVVCIVCIVLAEGYYLLTFYHQDKVQIADNLSQIETTKARIKQLEERLAHHEESKRELKKMQSEKVALLDTIPDQSNYSRYVNEIFNYLSNMIDGIELSVKNTENEPIQSALGTINARTYEISFMSTYSDSRNLLAHLNSMYQASNVISYSFDTGKQLVEGDEYLKYLVVFGDKLYEVGTTNIKLTVFYRLNNSVPDESYQVGHSEKSNLLPFANVRKEEEGIQASEVTQEAEVLPAHEVSSPVVQDLESSNFTLNIGDILSSGDTYKLSGPGEDEGHYIGLTTQSNTEIAIEVYEDYYTLQIKDDNGQIVESSVEEIIGSPSLNIISTMRALQDVMPNVHVAIGNYTNRRMPVSLSGSLLENIHIFDQSGEEIHTGEASDKISLT